MNEIKIKCPTCGKVLCLQEAPNIDAAFFTCPVCKEKHIVGKCQRYVENRSQLLLLVKKHNISAPHLNSLMVTKLVSEPRLWQE